MESDMDSGTPSVAKLFSLSSGERSRPWSCEWRNSWPWTISGPPEWRYVGWFISPSTYSDLGTINHREIGVFQPSNSLVTHCNLPRIKCKGRWCNEMGAVFKGIPEGANPTWKRTLAHLWMIYPQKHLQRVIFQSVELPESTPCCRSCLGLCPECAMVHWVHCWGFLLWSYSMSWPCHIYLFWTTYFFLDFVTPFYEYSIVNPNMFYWWKPLTTLFLGPTWFKSKSASANKLLFTDIQDILSRLFSSCGLSLISQESTFHKIPSGKLT